MSGRLLRRDPQLILQLLEKIATATADGGMLRAEQISLAGRSEAETRRHLRMLRDDQLLRYIDTRHLQDPDSMIIEDLTSAGWSCMEELRQTHGHPIPLALRRSWPVAERWIFGLCVPVSLAVLGWLFFG